MASSTCLACSLESGGKLTFLPDQHSCPQNPYISPSTQYVKGELSDTAIGYKDADSFSEYTFDSYADEAGLTAIYPEAGSGSFDAITYVILGLAGEAGEIANKWKKALRDIPKEYRDSDAYVLTIRQIKSAILDEIGDVLWYASRAVDEIGGSGTSLGEVAADNISKLNDRKSRNVIGGNGDDR